MDLFTFLMRSQSFPNKTIAEEFATHWTPVFVKKGAYIARQSEPNLDEFILLDGTATSRIYDAEGRDICVGLHRGACVLTPNIARTQTGISSVSIEATSDTVLMRINSETLTELMIASEPVRDWANNILREELAQKAGREWCLAALGGAERLAWFRQRHPMYETFFVHTLIASYLGVTPVTLSRLRARNA